MRWIRAIVTDSFILENRVVLILHGTHPFAAATARLLAQRRASIAVHYAPGDAFRSLVDEINQNNGRARGFRADLGIRRETEKMILDIGSQLGPIDTLVAGIPFVSPLGGFAEVEWETFQSRVLAEVKHAFYAIKAVLPGMLARKNGWIVGLSSSIASHPHFGLSAYGVSKSALSALLDSLALELEPWNIQVHTVSPAIAANDLHHVRLSPALASRLSTCPTEDPEKVAAQILEWLRESATRAGQY